MSLLDQPFLPKKLGSTRHLSKKRDPYFPSGGNCLQWQRFLMNMRMNRSQFLTASIKRTTNFTDFCILKGKRKWRQVIKEPTSYGFQSCSSISKVEDTWGSPESGSRFWGLEMSGGWWSVWWANQELNGRILHHRKWPVLFLMHKCHKFVPSTYYFLYHVCILVFCNYLLHKIAWTIIFSKMKAKIPL